MQYIQNGLARTVVQAPKFQHITLILKSFHCLEYKIISLTKFSTPLSHRISMTSFLFSILIVTAHALHVMSLSSNNLH